MNNIKVSRMIKQSIGVFLYLFISISSPLNAAESIVYGISIDNSVYQQGKSALRVSVFNITDQQFEEINYYTFPSSASYSYKSDIGSYPDRDLPNPIKGIEIVDGKIACVSVEFASNNYLIMSNFLVKLQLQEINKCGSYVFYGPKFEKNPIEELKSFYERVFPKKNPVIFRLITLDNSYPSQGGTSSLKEVINPSNPSYEKGDLGEHATDLTMTAFGYKKYLSKYGELGFDGIYVSDDRGVMIFSDSKWGYSSSVETLLYQSLNDEMLAKRIKELHRQGGNFAQTSNLIGDIFKTELASIYRFLHRIKDPGYGEGLLKVLHSLQKSFIKEEIRQIRAPIQPRLTLNIITPPVVIKDLNLGQLSISKDVK